MSNPTRTTPDAVAALLGYNYGQLPDGTNPDLQQYCDMASTVVDAAISAAQSRQSNLAVLNTMFNPEQVERALAAYYYTLMDPTYVSKSTAGASGSFAGNGSNLNGVQNQYKIMAIAQDNTGMVKALIDRQIGRSVWLGKPPSQQVPYSERS